MAEELENSKEQKVELIKRPLNSERVSSEETPDMASKTTPEHNDHRKPVVIVKKKAPHPVIEQSHRNKKQYKVVTTARAPDIHQPETVTLKVKEPIEIPAIKGQIMESPPISLSPVEKPERPPQVPETNVPAPPEKQVVIERHNGISSFIGTQRPAVVAGRVGGRSVGPRPPREDRSSRGGGGRPGGRPGTFRSDFGQNNRPAGQGQGYQSGSGHSPGGRHNFTPRPAFSPGLRPNGPGRPAVPRPAQTPATPSTSLEGKAPAKKTFKAKKAVYIRKEKEKERDDKLRLANKKKNSYNENAVPKSIEIMEVISVSELARKMNLRANALIQKLMGMGMMVTINEQIDAETASILALEYGTEVKIINLYQETLIKTEIDAEDSLEPRPPVVTVMGHVDHGKTKLLDAIRSADVAGGEFGGITQHIGAYTVDTPHGRITFLDTPGHEAFTRMRARGAQVTDIVVLVVAADDGVMPQTNEAINHAKDAAVPIVVAINKMDKPDANPDKVKSQLSDLGLIPEGWGGQTMFVEISALRKKGIEDLIEAILLQAEILDLKANYNRAAEGKILESRIDQGRGTVASIIIEKGTLKIGDHFVAGIWPGKVRALFNDKGERMQEATPSTPIEVIGFGGIPNAGDPLQVVSDEQVAKSISIKRQELKRSEDAKNIKKITLDNLHDTISAGAIAELKVIIKSDLQGSAEALRASLEKLSTSEVRLNVIQALPGAINEGDVELAIASNAIIIGFNVRPIPKAKLIAEQEKVDIRKYNIIYKAVEEIHQAMEGLLKPDTKESLIATVDIRNTFNVPKFGTIAGCMVQTGTVKRSASAHVVRDAIVIHTGKIISLRRFKDDVKEVAAGYECGMAIEGFDKIQVGDQLEVFEMIEVTRHL
ncbi:MAG: translation initiation factor IF-2 [Spirochaetaceae bacterium]|jgi:translation initiation factor IF-2|nr:translation initiation factor IF-2 [Spirochaetaceae bacterium]